MDEGNQNASKPLSSSAAPTAAVEPPPVTSTAPKAPSTRPSPIPMVLDSPAHAAPLREPQVPTTSALEVPTVVMADPAPTPQPLVETHAPSTTQAAPAPAPPATPPPPPPPSANAEQGPQSNNVTQNTPGTEDGNGGYRPLNVTDALSYLDAVKVRFSDKPDVYNHFLDIMKDFKSQQIDTPGVIDRVSSLFNGHPALIQGFNTFLPPGYRIDCSTNDNNTITVTTPSGTTTQTNRDGTIQRTTSIPHQAAPLASQSSSQPQSLHSGPSSFAPRPATPLVGPPDSMTMSPGIRSSTNAATVLGGMTKSSDPSRPNEEFSHAIQYVNKIKTRFSGDPETYKMFLEILQTYQKDQHQREPRTANDSQVYDQVQQLFQRAPDLLEEFRQFLPEQFGGGGGLLSIAAAGSGDAARGGPSDRHDKFDKTVKKKEPVATSNATQPAKRKKRVLDKDAPPVKPGAPKKQKHTHSKPEPPSPTFPTYHAPGSPTLPTHTTHVHGQQHHGHHPQQHGSAPSAPGPSHANTSPDEMAFFERVKKAMDNRETYDEFLKLLNLFAKDVIDLRTVVERSTSFLGDGSELLSQFKDIVGWEDRLDRLDFDPTAGVRGHAAARPRADTTGKHGPSYRRLPASEAQVACSGRDEMCKSVLNDEWVSHPTWASEDSGFVAHKKNSYEEALHKSEEERHEFDFHIEAIVRTIALLEPIHAKISQMNQDERALFKLKPGLGGQSKSIYQRIIKKVYGRDAGLEVIQALQESPAVAVPVVLTRLKQKDEEWRRAQREWNKVWREVDARNFYKSLDHQGITFKANDKKAITTKAFVSQIEAIKEEQTSKRASLIDPSFARTKPKHQLAFSFEDTSVLQDALKLVFSFLDRTQGQFTTQERQRIESFLREFIPLFLMCNPSEFDAAFAVHAEAAFSGNESEAGIMSDEVGSLVDESEEGSGSGRSTRNGRKSGGTNGVPAGDLRKRLLKSTQGKKQAATSAGGSRTSPAPPDAMDVDKEPPNRPTNGTDGPDDVWIIMGDSQQQPATAPPVREPTPPRRTRKGTFFTNTTFYTLLRLLQVLYSRLLTCKEIAGKLASDPKTSYLGNPIALELGLVDSPWPDPRVSLKSDGTNLAAHFYEQLLDSCEKLFDNDIDQATYEECMRFMFGTKAYTVFTLDKVVGAIIKQVQTVLTDNRSQELYSLLQRERETDAPTTAEQIRYRRKAEDIVGPDDHLFRINWIQDKKTTTMQLLGTDDQSIDDAETVVERWKQYMASYGLTHQTEGVSTAAIKHPFLRRSNLGIEPTSYISHSELTVRVCMRTYRLFFVTDTEDFYWRRTDADMLGAKTKLEEREAQRRAGLNAWLAKVAPSPSASPINTRIETPVPISS